MSDAERRQLEIQTLEARVAMLVEALTVAASGLTGYGVTYKEVATIRAALAATSEGVAKWRSDIEAKARADAAFDEHVALLDLLNGDRDDPVAKHALAEHDARERAKTLEEAFHAAAEAKLPVGYRWGRDAMESFHVGARQAAQAIRALASPAPATTEAKSVCKTCGNGTIGSAYGVLGVDIVCPDCTKPEGA